MDGGSGSVLEDDVVEEESEEESEDSEPVGATFGMPICVCKATIL